MNRWFKFEPAAGSSATKLKFIKFGSCILDIPVNNHLFLF